MKPIQVALDETILAELDKDEDVRRLGLSAVLTRLVREFLARKREHAVDEQYRRGYTGFDHLGPEFEGWEEMGEWPET
ncbi:MAG: hypothetical protein AAGD38_07005 [Acidobacteriota bacterium]